MSHRDRYLTHEDAMLLEEEIRRRRSSWRTYLPIVEALSAKLSNGTFVLVPEAPADVVVLGSRVRLSDMQTGQDRTRTLTLDDAPQPGEADAGQTLSVFSPLGQAILGASVGDVIRLCLEDRPCTLTIADVRQPTSKSTAVPQAEYSVG